MPLKISTQALNVKYFLLMKKVGRLETIQQIIRKKSGTNKITRHIINNISTLLLERKDSFPTNVFSKAAICRCSGCGRVRDEYWA